MALSGQLARADDGNMDVELLVVQDCPNEAPAAAVLRTALDEVGLSGIGIVTTVIDTWEEAVRRGFVGSPTFLINGVDPFSEPGRAPALACRVYPHPTGLTGVPDLSELRQALTRSTATPEEESQN